MAKTAKTERLPEDIEASTNRIKSDAINMTQAANALRDHALEHAREIVQLRKAVAQYQAILGRMMAGAVALAEDANRDVAVVGANLATYYAVHSPTPEAKQAIDQGIAEVVEERAA